MLCIFMRRYASMIMRGLALHRVADMIEEKRRRTYAAEEDEYQTA